MADEEGEMKRVRFTKNFEYEIRGPRGALLKGQTFRQGYSGEVLEAVARAAEKAGAIEYDERDDRRERRR